MFKKIILIALGLLFLNSCGIYKKTDARSIPTSGPARAKKNLEEGRGISLKNAASTLGGRTTYEFSTSNPLWRATLETLDFLPFGTVDYSGGVVITDWYSDKNSSESLKITVRFLSNELTANSIKIIIHKKICDLKNNNCTVSQIKSNIENELRQTILAKAAVLEKNIK